MGSDSRHGKRGSEQHALLRHGCGHRRDGAPDAVVANRIRSPSLRWAREEFELNCGVGHVELVAQPAPVAVRGRAGVDGDRHGAEGGGWCLDAALSQPSAVGGGVSDRAA